MSATPSQSSHEAAALPAPGMADRAPRPAVTDPVAPRSGLNKEFLHATIVYDLLWSAFQVGTLATLLNACAKIDAEWTLRSWRHLLFDNNKIMQLALRYGPDIGLSEATSADISRFYQDVAAEKRRLAPLANTATRYSPAERRQIAVVATAWRRLALEAKSILPVFEADTVRQLDGLLVEDMHALLHFLDEAGAGGHKRVRPSGEISLPDMRQMRREPRMPLDGRCTVIVGDDTVAASLNDVSTSGMGIVCTQPMTEKQPITIVLEDGRRLDGTVARRHGDRVALLFATRLSHADPLFHRPKRPDRRA